MDVFEKTIHQPCVLHKDGKGLSSVDGISGFYDVIIEPGLGDGLCRLPDQVPDPLEDHRMLRVVLPDFFILPAQLLGHGRHLRVEVGVLRLDLLELPFGVVELPPVRPLGQFPEDVSGSAVVERLVRSPGNMLQPVVLGLEIRQVRHHLLEGIIRKLPRG